jgi:hypothetical protein
LLIEQCPADWKHLDLYLFRDDQVVFYVGQSFLAFARVWEHLKSGFKGHSVVGRFIWANWPVSMKFTIELMSSRSEEFNPVGNDLLAVEGHLIRFWSPCFNVSLNNKPTPVPACYFPYNAKLRCSRSLNALIHQAERAVKADNAALWVEDVDPEWRS